MHYYQFNIADYRKDTVHLSSVEHFIYRSLIDSYYLTEQPISLDHAHVMRTHCLRSADDMQFLCNVLADFFVKTETGYIHKRIEEELAIYHGKSAQAKAAADARWDKIRNKINEKCLNDADALQAQSVCNANHKPITNNHKLLKPIAHPSDIADVMPSAYTQSFLKFWEMYPNKKSKGLAAKAFAKIKSAEYPAIKDGLNAAKASSEWLKDNGKFIPHPASWINARGWEDERTSAANESKPYDMNEFMMRVQGLS